MSSHFATSTASRLRPDYHYSKFHCGFSNLSPFTTLYLLSLSPSLPLSLSLKLLISSQRHPSCPAVELLALNFSADPPVVSIETTVCRVGHQLSGEVVYDSAHPDHLYHTHGSHYYSACVCIGLIVGSSVDGLPHDVYIPDHSFLQIALGGTLPGPPACICY